MSQLVISVAEVSPESRNFTIVAELESVLPEAVSHSGTVKYQKLLFRDREGTEISAIMFDEDIELFSETFHEGHEYQITNPVITPIRADVRRANQRWQMIIKPRTQIVELPRNELGPRSYIVFLDACLDSIGHPGRLDIMGFALHVRAPRKVQSRCDNREFDACDIILLDRSLRPYVLTVWHGLVENEARAVSEAVASLPIVLVTNVLASTFGGGCWSSSVFSVVRLNPEIPETNALRRWGEDNAEEIARIRESQQVTVDETVIQVQQSQAETVRIFIPIAELSAQEEGLTVWVKGRISEVLNQDRCIYTSCNVCKKKTEIELGKRYSCFHTTTPHTATSVNRCYLQINVCDNSGTAKLTLFDEVAETVLQRTAEQISSLSSEEYNSFIDDFLEKNKFRKFAIKLVTYKIGDAIRQLRFRAQHAEEVIVNH